MGLAKLTRKLFSPLYYAHYEHSPQVFRLFKKYCKCEQLSRSQLDRLSLRLLKRLLVHAGKHTPYYRRVFYDYGFNPKKFENPEQLEVLPVLTKKVIRTNQDDLIAENIDRSELHDSSTGGTSGIKLKFYRNNLLRSHRLALQWRSDIWAGWDLHENVGYIWPTIQDFDKDSGIKEKIFSKYFTGVQAHYAGKMNDDRKEEIAQELAHFKPRIIRCFSTPAAAVANYFIENDIRITGVNGVVSTGEPLYPDQREIIEKAFNAPVFNLYASREVGTTAAECERHEHLHLATDSVAVEVTNNGCQLAPGQYGEILITDLLNYGMPMIRYQIGDYGQLVDGDCPCGRPFPLMKDVVGRCADAFVDADGNFIVALSMQVYLIEEGPYVGQVQVIQNNLTDVTVRMTPDPRPNKKVKDYYTKTIKKVVKGVQRVHFEIVDRIKPEKSGKYRFTICKIPPRVIEKIKAKGKPRR